MSDDYRVLSRTTALLVALIFIGCCAALAFGATAAFERYTDGIVALQARSPGEAAAALAYGIRVFAFAQLAIVALLSAALARYGQRALRSGAMPPPGSWIVAGQHVRLGASARLAGWLAIGCAGLVTLLSCGVAVIARGERLARTRPLRILQSRSAPFGMPNHIRCRTSGGGPYDQHGDIPIGLARDPARKLGRRARILRLRHL